MKSKKLLILAFGLTLSNLTLSAQHGPGADLVPARYNFLKKEVVKKTGVKTTSDYEALAAADKVASAKYYDGLGRMLATIAVRASGNQKDIVAFSAYDNVGRPDTTFLPYVGTTTDGSFSSRAAVVNYQKDFYNNTSDKIADDTKPYGVNIYDPSPASYLKEQGAPGINWQPGSTHTVRRTSYLNGASEIRIWKPNLTSPGYYLARQVVIEEITDENGNKVKSWIDKSGNILEKHVQSGTSTWLKTLYIYDEQGRVVTILQPEGVNALSTGTTITTAMSGPYGFFYTYDAQGRIVEKKVPGAAVVYYCYDPLGRLALMQDGNLRTSNKWFYIKYDRHGRAVIQGVYTNTTYTTRSTVQASVLDVLSYSTGETFYEKMTSGGTHGYTNQSFPTSNATVLSVTYYDSYDTDMNGTADYSYTSQSLSATTPQGSITEASQFATVGRVTATKVNILGTSDWLMNYVFYDYHGNVIQMRSNNHLRLTVDNLVTNLYDFTGKLWVSKKYLDAGTPGATTVLNRYDYDEAGRVTKIYQKNNSDTEALLVNYNYNELGQLVDKKLHNTGGSNYMQSVDYRYHIRGWMLSINNAQLNIDSKNDEATDYFGMELLYDVAETGISDSAYYNGNISATKWKTVGEASGNAGRRSYAYKYDRSNRLTKATFQAYGTSSWNKEAGTLDEGMTYTANGNITTLTRKHNNRGLSGITVTSTPETLDGLSYTYASGFGNKLTKVEDSGLTAGFNNTVTANAEYKYDTIGNLIKDRNKGIDSIKYNDLGKVSRIKFSTGAFIVYSYDAAGTKLKVRNYNTSGTLVTTTDYVGGFVYTNNALSFFGSPEGRVVKNGSNLEYQYAISDHQGNTRVVFSSAAPSAVVKTATFEGSGGDNSGEFSNVTGVVSFTAANHTPSGIKVVRMNQSTPVGPAKSLKVFPGDKVDMEVYSYYESSSGYGTTNNTVGAMVTAIAGAFGGVSGAGGESGSIFNSINAALGGFGIGSNPGDTRPSAFLNYVLVDQNYKVVDAGWTVVPSSANFAKQLISIPQLTIKEAGYIFMYLSYEDLSNNYVYFDDFKITHTPSNLIQANEYYPFGMQNENSWTRENATGNNFMYNQSSELNQTTGWYDLPYRAFDPILGRFNGVDALASTYESTSPYSYGSNNPIYFSDPTGLGSVAGIELINNELIIDFNHIGTHGGHWSNDGSNGGAGSYNDFNSADAAFWAGYAYNEYHESWGSIPGMAGNPVEARFNFECIKAYRSMMQNLVASSGGTDLLLKYFWFSDKQGETLGMHWLNGTGIDLSFIGGEWGDYMRSSLHLNSVIQEIIDNDYATRKKSGHISMDILGETGSNDRRSGYGMLHGTLHFHLSISVEGIGPGKFAYNGVFTWVDRIDPSARQGDTPWVDAARTLGYVPRDYNIRIAWSQSYIGNPK